MLLPVLQQPSSAGCFSFDTFLKISYLVSSSTAGSLSERSFQSQLFVSPPQMSSAVKALILQKKKTPLRLRTVRVNKWLRRFHYASSVFKAYTLASWHFWSLLCKMWKQRQPFAASTGTHGIWPALRCTPVPLSFQLSPLSDVRRYTDILTQSWLWVLEDFISFFILLLWLCCEDILNLVFF